jgi:predicted Zn finger-like uncharacterized protein
MDVRCERCQTEYELDDGSIGEDGTPVQCTACGHTFQVTPPPVPAAPIEPEDSPLPAEWLLETVDGPVHRFRSLTSLQKWIVERKVTREDRISRTGQAWRRLGEIVELSPFFELVDEADRARATASTTREQKQVAENVSRAAEAARRRESVEQETDVVRRPRSGGALRVAIMLGVAAVVAYVGIARAWRRPIVMQSLERLNLMASPPPPPAAAAAPAPPPAVVPPDAAPASLPDAAPDGPLAAAPVAPAEEKWTYVQLVTEADHLLESGATERARLLYKRAQAVKPAGPEALSGLGYVALDRGKTGLALALFKRALTTNGSFGPALFGLAETQRTLGQDDRALENYRRYVNADPSGEDVQAARRHIRLLGEAAQARPAATPP